MTYTWQATGESNVVRTTSATSDTVAFSWSTPGAKTVQITAANCGGSDTDVLAINVVDPCPNPLTSVGVGGPTSGYIDTAYGFTAQVQPTDATTPVTYTWQATGKGNVVRTTSSTQDTVSFSWDTPGAKTVQVAAQNCGGSDSATHVVQITDTVVLLDMVDLDGPTTVLVGATNDFTATVSPPVASLPVTFTWQTPGMGEVVDVQHTTSSVMPLSWSTTGEHEITVTAANRGGSVSTTRGVIVQPPPQPDLVPFVWRDGSEVWYQLWNRGALVATAGHSVALSVDGVQVDTQVVGVDLSPNDRLNGVFAYALVCAADDTSIAVTADVGAVVDESDETNNTIERDWLCDVTPPQIISGPTISEVTTRTVTVSWETDEDTQGHLWLDKDGGAYEMHIYITYMTREHQLQMGGLDPYHTYRYYVTSSDANGNESASESYIFKTEAVERTLPPLEPSIEFAYEDGVYMAQASLTDTVDVEFVQFSFNGESIGTDYSFDADGLFKAPFNPRQHGLSRGEFFDTQHTLDVEVATAQGEVVHASKDVVLPRDVMRVDLDILSPPSTVTIPGAMGTVDVTVYAAQYTWGCVESWGTSWGIGPVGDYCGDVREAVDYVEFWINGVLAHTSYPSDDQDTTHTYTFVAYSLPYVLEAHAYDTEGVGHTTQTTFSVVEAAPSLNIQRGVTKMGNYFQVQLTIQNDANATGDARIDRIRDNVTGLQVVHEATDNYSVTSRYSYWRGDTARMNRIDIDLFDTASGSDYYVLAPGEEMTIDYLVVPILYENPVDLYIGDSDIKVYYAGEETSIGFATPRIVMTGWAEDAIGEADYVIVTNPSLLFQYHSDSGNKYEELNVLLSTMGRLATLKQGVLGYLETYDDGTILKSLLHWNQGWAGRLDPDFDITGGGYLLIVGEEEIVPAFTITGYDIHWSNGSVTTQVPLSDHPYSNTAGGEDVPEIAVGRIIGDSAEDLITPLQTSINVFQGVPGYSFDRSHAFLESGSGNCWQSFIAEMENLADMLEPGMDVAITHPMYDMQLDAFPRTFDLHDGFAAGDVNDDGVDEIVIADRDDHFYILDMNGVLLDEFNRTGISNEFEVGDRLAVGDVRSTNPGDEILIGDRNDNIYIYDQYGQEIHHFDVNFAMFDGLATGDVDDDGRDEIIFADQSGGGHIYIYEGTGTPVDDFPSSYQEHDGLAVGDVMGGPEAEIIIGSQADDMIYVYQPDGTPVGSLDREFNPGDGLAAGDVVLGGRWEIVMADQDDWIQAYYYSDALGEFRKMAEFPLDFDEYDGLAVGEVMTGPSPNEREILVADRADWVITSDMRAYERLTTQIKANVYNRDILHYSGHGSSVQWEGLAVSDFPVDFGDAKPVALAPSCLTGNYGGNSVAEAFLSSGAGAYMGATEVSGIGANLNAGEWLHENWIPNEPIGQIFRRLKTHYWVDLDDDFWVREYNLYGDPKYGAPAGSLAGVNAVPATRQLVPDSPLSVVIPDYQVSQLEGYDYVEIPGGSVWLQAGDHRLPFWSVRYDYPAGQWVQTVTMLEQTGLVTDTGLLLPVNVNEPACCDGGQPTVTLQDPPEGWVNGPGEPFQWQVQENAGGGTTLILHVYPFYYYPQTTNVKFYKSYTFSIETITSTVAVDWFLVGKPAYAQGEQVLVNLAVNNAGDAQDVVVEASIEAADGEVVDGALLHTLHDLAGQGSVSFEWDSSGFEPGYYDVVVTLRDGDGNLLDEALRGFRLGIVEGQVTSLTATPSVFKAGDGISISMTFANTGTAVVQVQAVEGVTVTATFTQPIANLAPGSEVVIEKAWDTSGATEDTYRILGYVQYDSRTTPPRIVTVSTKHRVYLPLVMK